LQEIFFQAGFGFGVILPTSTSYSAACLPGDEITRDGAHGALIVYLRQEIPWGFTLALLGDLRSGSFDIPAASLPCPSS